MRLVDADALKEDCRMANDCKDCKTYVRDCEYDRIYTKMDFCGWIDDAPTVDAEPVVHGRWIIKDNPGTGWYRVTCSECGEDVTSVAPVIGFFPKAKVTWDFCPNCGAKMDGKDGEQNDTV